MNRLAVSVASVVAILAATPNTDAAPITYELTSVASGKIGGTTFTNASVDLIGIGDTANVTDLSSFFPGVTLFGNPFSKFTVTIAGVGTATITDASEIWAFPAAVPGFAPEPLVIFGREDVPPALNSITGIGFNVTSALAGYIGATAIGPIAGAGGIGFNPLCSTPNHDACLHTDLGLLSFTAQSTLDDHSTFVATVGPVPEPTSLLLLGSGIAALVGRRRFSALRAGKA